jgi:hypothetical protein
LLRPALLIILAAPWWACPVGLLASLPDWLRDAAHTPLGKYPEDTNAVILLDEQVTTVMDNGEFRTLYRRAYKILRPAGREHGKVVAYLDSETSLNRLRAWGIPASGGVYEVGEKEALETGLFPEALYGDARFKALMIPAADPGNIIGYEYEQRRRPSILQATWWIQEDVPIAKARFQLQLPADWEYETFWRNQPGVNPCQLGQNQWQWELNDVHAVEPETLMPAFRAVAGRMGVTCYPRGGKNQGSWQGIGLWYAQLVADRRQPDAAIRQKVQELTSTATGTMEKIRALAGFVQKEIRYVAIEIGIGGFQPHPATKIFAEHYGDCKDKVTLLSTMLQVAGVKSYYVLVDTDRGVLAPDFPTAQTFNHVILAIQLPPDVHEMSLWSLQSHAQLGQLLFFDPTDVLVPLGWLPASLQAGYGLVVSDQGGELVKLPLLSPALNRLLRSAKVVLGPDGKLYGNVEEIRWGAPADDLRAQLLRANEADRRKVLETFLGQFLTASTLQELEVQNLEKAGQSLVVSYTFTAPSYAKQAGDLLLVRLCVLGHKSEEILEEREKKERRYPVEFSYATTQTDEVEITLPQGYKLDELPPALELKTGPVNYTSKAEAAGNVIRYKRLYQIGEVALSSDLLGEFKKLNRQIATDERSSAVLKRLSP